MEHRSLSLIASEIRAAWPNPSPYALPYLRALSKLSSVEDFFGADSALSVILYFLSNASTFRGPKAKALKSELKSIVRSTGYRI